MRVPICAFVFILASISSPASVLTPRNGLTYVPGAQDLIQAGQWSCVVGVSVGASSLTIAATTNHNPVLDSGGPALHPQGDFSVLAELSAPSSSGTFLSLVG